MNKTLHKFKLDFGSTSNQALTRRKIFGDCNAKSVTVQNSMVENTLVSNTDFRGVSDSPPRRQLKRRRRGYLPLSRVQKVFPELSPKDLVSLVELTSYTPSKVLALVPSASSTQLGALFDIIEETLPAPRIAEE